MKVEITDLEVGQSVSFKSKSRKYATAFDSIGKITQITDEWIYFEFAEYQNLTGRYLKSIIDKTHDIFILA